LRTRKTYSFYEVRISANIVKVGARDGYVFKITKAFAFESYDIFLEIIYTIELNASENNYCTRD